MAAMLSGTAGGSGRLAGSRWTLAFNNPSLSAQPVRRLVVSTTDMQTVAPVLLTAQLRHAAPDRDRGWIPLSPTQTP